MSWLCLIFGHKFTYYYDDGYQVEELEEEKCLRCGSQNPWEDC